jgi:glutathione S-transferase
MPVSNFGARVKMLILSKEIENQVEIKDPSAIGGLKSAEYLDLNIQGKMPLLVTGDGMPIPESDTICRYLLEKYPQGPSFQPTNLNQKMLSEQICRTHDVYIGNPDANPIPKPNPNHL